MATERQKESRECRCSTSETVHLPRGEDTWECMACGRRKTEGED